MRQAFVIAAVVLTSSSSVATADVLATALGQPLTEISHAVDVSVKDGIAVYRVRRVFANAGTVADEARLDIDLPYGAAATGLRIRARDRWYDGELMEAARAAQLYQELTGRGVWQPKDPALLYWRWADKLTLQVFPVLPGATSTVEYTLTVPTRYSGGRVFLSYPRLAADADPNLAVPVFTITPGWGDATTAIQVDGARVAPEAPLVLAAPVAPPWLAAIDHDPSASYATSAIAIEDTPEHRRGYATAKVTIDLEHTYRSDVRIALYPPGERDPLAVFDGSGGGDNDVRGTFDVALPRRLSAVGTWRLVISDHAALDAGTLASWSLELGDGKRVKKLTAAATDTPVFVPDAPENASDGGIAMIAIAPPVIDGVATRFGRVVASKQHAFARLEVDAAPELRALPKQAQVVFVIDASHSMGDSGIAAQLGAARAYLRHVPDAQVEIVAYRRTATRLFDRFVPASEVARHLALATTAGKLAPGNGSALDDGARVAAAALVGRKGPLRVVITTDNLLRARFDNHLALAALEAAPPGTTVHVVETSTDGSAALARDDAHPLAPIALAHHGIGATLVGIRGDDKHLPAIVLGLVRPVRVDHFAIAGLDLAQGKYDTTVPDVLDEGAGFRIVVDAPIAPERVELTGMIWGDKFRRVVTADAGFSKAAAAWVFSEDDHQALSPAEMMTVALMGRAVSPVTSYLAIEPGVRPSTIGLERNLEGVGFGVASGSAHGGGVGGVVRVPPDPMALVADGAARCVATHQPAPGWSVTLTLEATRDEVVDVIPGAGAALPIAACLIEATWAIRLDDAYHDTRATYPLHFH